MKIISIVGARPQFVKLAPLSKILKKHHKEVIIHTGQHYDKEMSELFFRELEIEEPKYNLDINSGLHGNQTGRMLIDLEQVILNERPDIVIVFGDTNSTLAGSLISSKLHIPSIHIEAGLRSYNRKMPEEINRIIADQLSDYLFVPTKIAMNNLINDNMKNKAYYTGDIMVDSINIAKLKSNKSNIVNSLNIKKEKYILLTLHRPYNVDNPNIIKKIFDEIDKLPMKIVFPIHPRTRNIVENNKIKIPQNVMIIKPLGYLDFIQLQVNAIKILTDSGGIQKEAYILKKPCITLRSETEWIETIESGWNMLINPILEEGFYKKIKEFEPTKEHVSLFGEDVANKMVEIINNIKI